MHIQTVPANSPVLPWVTHGNRIMQADPIRKAVCELDAAKFCPKGMEYGMRESDAWIEWYAPLNAFPQEGRIMSEHSSVLAAKRLLEAPLLSQQLRKMGWE